MAQGSPLTVATHRLIEKQKNVSELKGTGQNFCQDSDSKCLIEQVGGGETRDTVPAQTVRVLPAGGPVVADQESEETLPDIRSDVGSHIPVPLVGRVAGEM